MTTVATLVARMRSNVTAVRFAELRKVCVHYFGEPRHDGGSHTVFRTPWPGDPRVNIQNRNGQAKPYQVRQVLKAIDRLEEGR